MGNSIILYRISIIESVDSIIIESVDSIIIESVDSIIIESVDSISRDERDVPLTQYITNA